MGVANDAPVVTRRGAPVVDPQERRRLIAAHFKLLQQLEAEDKRVEHRNLLADDHGFPANEQNVGIDGGEAFAGGECWLSKFLAVSLTLGVGMFIVFVITAHQHQLRVFFA